jgi:hypothetical protein
LLNVSTTPPGREADVPPWALPPLPTVSEEAVVSAELAPLACPLLPLSGALEGAEEDPTALAAEDALAVGDDEEPKDTAVPDDVPPDDADEEPSPPNEDAPCAEPPVVLPEEDEAGRPPSRQTPSTHCSVRLQSELVLHASASGLLPSPVHPCITAQARRAAAVRIAWRVRM